MSPDVEIIIMTAFIWENSGFRLICLVLLSFLVTELFGYFKMTQI